MRKKKKQAKPLYTCSCGAQMPNTMSAVRAHTITECPNVRRATR